MHDQHRPDQCATYSGSSLIVIILLLDCLVAVQQENQRKKKQTKLRLYILQPLYSRFPRRPGKWYSGTVIQANENSDLSFIVVYLI